MLIYTFFYGENNISSHIVFLKKGESLKKNTEQTTL